MNEEFIDLIREPLYQSWAAVEPDAEEASDNEYAVEIAMDANRLSYFGGPEGKVAEEALMALLPVHGWAKVVSFVAKHVHLV